MGFLSRSVSIMRLRVKGEIEGSFWDAVDAGIRKGAYREIDTPGVEVGMGWASIEDFTDYEFTSASYLRAHYVALSLRVDTARVPPRILEIELKKESQKLLAESGQRKLSSAQRRQLKDNIKESLKRRMFPSIQVYDLVWDTSKHVAYFGSLSGKVLERVTDHFKKCFGLTLIPIIPYLRAEELLEETNSRAGLENLKPSSMVP
ncbi:MAG: recombination-associated protein RdgC [Desulfomonile tiedjei]|nr:recombination-associated protein RdgC [Desulfomonile tiedjei]